MCDNSFDLISRLYPNPILDPFARLFIFCFSTGDLAWTIVKGPLEALLGIAYGCILGIFLWFIPAKKCVSDIQ